MAAVLDIIGSLAIRSAMVLVILNLTLTLNTALYDKTAAANAKQTLEVSAEVMYQDLRQAGYNAVAPAFLAASSVDMQFKADIDNDGSAETIRLYGIQDATTGLWKAYRTVNGGTALVVASSLTDISFTYLDKSGVATSTLSSIAAIGAKMIGKIEGISSSDTTATKEFKEFKVFPLNL